MAEDYSVNLKANLNTADVQEKLNDLRFKGTHATSDLEIAVKKLDNAVQDLTRTWEKQAEAARKAAERSEEAARANSQGDAATDEEASSFMKLGKGYFNARRFKALKRMVDKMDGADGESSELGTVLSEGLGGAALGAMVGKGNPAFIVGGAINGVVDGFKKVEQAAKAAAQKLQDVANNNRREYREFLIGEQQRIAKEKTLESITGGTLTDAELKAYVDNYQKKKSEYEERIGRGAEDSQTEQEYMAEMDALMKSLNEYEEFSDAAQKELDKRAKAEEKATKAAEKKAAADEKAAKKAQEQAEREFQKSVRDEQQAQEQENRDNERAHRRLQALQFDETMAQWQK